jgi:hypothetical protein
MSRLIPDDAIHRIQLDLEEVAPGRWRVLRPRLPPARSELPAPHVVSDEMDPVEQVDGRFYTSKKAFRAVGRANGLTEVGTEKFKPMVRSSVRDKRALEQARVEAIKKAVAQVKSR